MRVRAGLINLGSVVLVPYTCVTSIDSYVSLRIAQKLLDVYYKDLNPKQKRKKKGLIARSEAKANLILISR